MSSAFFNAVPKACAAIPTMASSFFCEKNLRVSSGLAGLLKSPEQKFFWKVGPRVIMPQNLITCDSLVLPDQLLCFAYFVSGVS